MNYLDIQKRHLDTSKTIIHIQDYPTHVFFKNSSSPNPTLFHFFSEPTNHKNPFPRTGIHDLLVTHDDCEENEQKTLHKYAINQVTQCETGPQEIETTNMKPHFIQKPELQHQKDTNIQQHSVRKKNIVNTSQMETKIDFITNLSIKVL